MYSLIFAVAALVVNALYMIPGFSVACFPSLCAWLTSFFTLISLVIDLVMFYIAKARIDKVPGASATIGLCVWLTLATWVVTGVLGCLVRITSCCSTRVKNDQEESRKRDASYKPMKQDTPPRDDGNYPDHIIERVNPKAGTKETEVAAQIARYGSHSDEDEEYKLDHYGSRQPGSLPYGTQQPIDGVGYGYGQRARTSEEYLLNPTGQPRQVTPPSGDRGYLPSSAAYPDPYAQETLAQNPYGNTPFLAGSSNNLAPGHPPQANDGQNRAMTPASTYAGSFVGVGSGRHEGMPLPAGMGVGVPEHVLMAGAVAGGAAYAGARQMRQGSGQQQPCEFVLLQLTRMDTYVSFELLTP
ncbi:hypothetical protein QFC22_003704 [Naganishia vaughanmartiniae]|uniref:Uncharacterized protein n=1 Tax=Naganishia vaughanmartiniae TaxID=1424756 RepID=A0ACC2X5M2_9TREE|nr:hypothetical protein QFC22_003704 [Naganishia vaughanmartiniae]